MSSCHGSCGVEVSNGSWYSIKWMPLWLAKIGSKLQSREWPAIYQPDEMRMRQVAYCLKGANKQQFSLKYPQRNKPTISLKVNTNLYNCYTNTYFLNSTSNPKRRRRVWTENTKHCNSTPWLKWELLDSRGFTFRVRVYFALSISTSSSNEWVKA